MSKSGIDRNEAPVGYRAYVYGGNKGYTCSDCEISDVVYCDMCGCFSCDRKDGVSVIFKKIKGEAND